MNSCLYECVVMHHRIDPVEHRFIYRTFQFYLDLNEIDEVAERLRFFSRNRFNLFDFRDPDHMSAKGNVRNGVEEYVRGQGVDTDRSRIMLLTNVRTFGYVFNPVSFYYFFRPDGVPLCSVAEVGNTYGEMKPYFLPPDSYADAVFNDHQKKKFYVSPFFDLDTGFDFRLRVPEEKLNIRIDVIQEGKRRMISSLTGNRIALTDANLVKYSLRFPLITLKVIGAIHWQAFRLWWKGVPYHKKSANPELQEGIYRGNHN